MKRALQIAALSAALLTPSCVVAQTPRLRPLQPPVTYTQLYRPGFTDADRNGIDDRIDHFLATGGCAYWTGGPRDTNRNGIDDRLEFSPRYHRSPFRDRNGDGIDDSSAWKLRPGTCAYRYAPGLIDMDWNGIDDRDQRHLRPRWRATIWFGYHHHHRPWLHHWHGPWRYRVPPRYLRPHAERTRPPRDERHWSRPEHGRPGDYRRSQVTPSRRAEPREPEAQQRPPRTPEAQRRTPEREQRRPQKRR